MKWTSIVLAGFILLLGLSISNCRNDDNGIDTVAAPLLPAIEKIHIADPYFHKKVLLKTRVFYRANEYHHRWLKKGRPDKLFTALMEEIDASVAYGLSPADYGIGQLAAEVKALYSDRDRDAAEVSNLDIRITASFFLFTTHLLEGRIRYPGAREFFWEKGMPLENDIALLLGMESSGDLKDEIERLQPEDPLYQRLQQALMRYRQVEEADTLPRVSSRLHVRPGESHADIPLIRCKLQLTEDFKGRMSSSDVYDDQLEEAVRRFQARHGQQADAVLDAETVRLLNVRIKGWTQVIALNLERLRWYPQVRLDEDVIVINVPEYMLHVYRNENIKMRMRVVLGSEYTPTPVFHDTLKYLVFSPAWTVPGSIFENEFLPKLRENPLHFSTERFVFYKDDAEIDPAAEDWKDDELDARRYAVVEKPNEANSLGNVKFIMPNNFSVYLHDTPAAQLFERAKRALSHGCIRLEKPADLAHYLLRGQKGWDRKRIREAMQSGEPLQVDLARPFPVYIVYRTAWVDEERVVHFRKDVYGHDQRQLEKLEQKIAGGL